MYDTIKSNPKPLNGVNLSKVPPSSPVYPPPQVVSGKASRRVGEASAAQSSQLLRASLRRLGEGVNIFQKSFLVKLSDFSDALARLSIANMVPSECCEDRC